ncbi:alternative ribosome rescue aminoacyl-tRNA hydrolase ArfB [Frankia sp. Cr2]|uniref:alternative ribosome rescue aminoacyl-tRNA hydrolase ArfB n=1 Tax=Frankia sp. Cr2 TaxID=3073932 RepID=UPI002AD4213C|nr:alternative ribosome rescue aminoacyl-tRNA hydrolase ArfB [Frankia sp. Cr2]
MTFPPSQVRPGFVLRESDLTWRFSRSSGPGGQGVNTSDSRVEVSFDVRRSPSLPERLRERTLTRLEGRLVDGVLTITSSEHRSQLRNREAALARLTATLRTASEPPPRARRPTRPSAGAVQRRITGKKQRARVLRQRRADPDD